MRIVDLGTMWGFPTARIFRPWDVEVFEPATRQEVDDLIGEGADLVLFGGGADVDPRIYGHRNLSSGTNQHRDREECETWDKVVEAKIPILGICRGSQFVCAKSGGTLVQHLNGHGLSGTHAIVTADGKHYEITSTHHQLMYPFDVEHELIAWAAPSRSDRYTWAGDNPDFSNLLAKHEPEIVYFPKTQALGVQGHPEYFHNVEHPTVQYIRKLVAEKLLKKEFN